MWRRRSTADFDTTADSDIERRLREHVHMLAGDIGVRHLQKPGTLAAAAGYIRGQLGAAEFRVTDQPLPNGSGGTANLVAEITGRRTPGQILIVGAHYDTVLESPGADDNASAVAVLLEVARLLRDHAPGKTIRFAAFPCEEAPYFDTGDMGSQHHAKECRRTGQQVIGMLCLEMLGYYRDAPGSQQLPPGIPRWLRPAFPSRANFLGAIGNPRSWWLCWRFRRGFRTGSRFPLFSVVLPESIPEIRRSDNSSFWDQGYPALMVTDTSFLRSPHYHQASDTPDTLNYSRMTHVTAGIAAAVKYLAR